MTAHPGTLHCEILPTSKANHKEEKKNAKERKKTPDDSKSPPARRCSAGGRGSSQNLTGYAPLNGWVTCANLAQADNDQTSLRPDSCSVAYIVLPTLKILSRVS